MCRPILCASRIVEPVFHPGQQDHNAQRTKLLRGRLPITIHAVFMSRLFRRQWPSSAMAWICFMSVELKRLLRRRHSNDEHTSVCAVSLRVPNRAYVVKGEKRLPKTLERRSRSLMGSAENWTPQARTLRSSASHEGGISPGIRFPLPSTCRRSRKENKRAPKSSYATRAG